MNLRESGGETMDDTFAGKRAERAYRGNRRNRVYDGLKTPRLGTGKNPAAVTVQTEERLKELESVFAENGWEYTIDLQPGKSEDITDLEVLLNPVETETAEKKVGRNDPCPCGSGKKYKKCCG